jgi:gluconolactonase
MHKAYVALLALAVFVAQREVAADDLKEAKVGAITLKTPANWKQSKPTSRLRLAQFSIPAVEGDHEAAELAIFSFGAGGGIKANVDRWIGQFATEGRKAKTTSGKSKTGEYVFVEIGGTYRKPVGPPVLRKTESMANARMLGVILAVEGEGTYFLKMTGPDKTVISAADAFRASFGGDAASEKPFEG